MVAPQVTTHQQASPSAWAIFRQFCATIETRMTKWVLTYSPEGLEIVFTPFWENYSCLVCVWDCLPDSILPDGEQTCKQILFQAYPGCQIRDWDAGLWAVARCSRKGASVQGVTGTAQKEWQCVQRFPGGWASYPQDPVGQPQCWQAGKNSPNLGQVILPSQLPIAC